MSAPQPPRTSKLVHVELWTDGACAGNPGPGGWAAILTVPGVKQLELSGSEPHTTNNRMELTAVVEGLRAFHRPAIVTLHSDSRLVCDALAKDWISGWRRRGWRKASGEAVKNADLWQALDAARAAHRLDVRWVEGHAGTELNERCDQLAVAARDAAAAGARTPAAARARDRG